MKWGIVGAEVIVSGRSIDNQRMRFMFPMAALWLVACFVLQLSLVNRGLDPALDVGSWVWVGSMWAGWAGSLWLLSAMRISWLKCAAFAVAITWHAGWMSFGRDQTPLRYLIMFGGYGVVQSVLFRLFRVPSWASSPMRLVPPEEGRRQFAIVELLLVTTVAALFIAAAKRYQPPSGQAFWLGLPMVFLSLGMIASCCAQAIGARERMQRRLFAVGVLVAISLGSFAIAWLDELLNPSPIVFSPTTSIAWMPYHSIQAIFAVLFIMLAVCGRTVPLTDEKSVPAEEDVPAEKILAAENAKTPNPPTEDDDEFPPSSDLLPFRRPPHK